MKFKPMLAAAIKDLSSLKYPLIVSPKLDGIRAMVQNGKLVSRNLKPIPNKFTASLFGPECEGLDGELIVGDPTDKDVFNTTSSGVMSREGEPNLDFHVFDSFHESLEFPRRFSESVFEINDVNPFCKVVPHDFCRCERDLLDHEARYLEQGYEGLMIRSIDGLYKQGRSTVNQGWLLKLKRFTDAEAVIIGVEEAQHNGNILIANAQGHLERSSKKAGLKPMGTLGAIKVRGINGDFKGVEFHIGTGFNDEQRTQLWSDKDLIGKIVTFKYFPIGCVEAPRFPVFKGLRSKEDMS